MFKEKPRKPSRAKSGPETPVAVRSGVLDFKREKDTFVNFQRED